MRFTGPSLEQVLILLVIILVIILVPLLIYRPLAKKAGFSGWWALVCWIPFVNIVVLWVFAFIEWPVEKSKKE